MVILTTQASEAGADEHWKILAHAEVLLAEFGIDSERVKLPTRFGLRAARAILRARENGGVQLWIVASTQERAAAALAAGPGTPLVVRVPVPGQAGQLATLKPLRATSGRTAAFATVAIGEAGAKNAALLVAAFLAAAGDQRLRAALQAFRRAQTETVLATSLPDDERIA